MVDLIDNNFDFSNVTSDFDLNCIRLNAESKEEKVEFTSNEDHFKWDSFEPNVLQCLESNERILQDGIISLDTIREAQLLHGYIQGILKTLDKHENHFLRKGILIHRRYLLKS